MGKFVRAVSLRIGGFLVVLGGLASMKAKVAKTEFAARRFAPWAVCRSGIG
jgi:hypothetical protein